MADELFIEEYKRLLPRLDAGFHNFLKKNGHKIDKAFTKDDLMQLVLLEALEEYRKPHRESYKPSTLLFLKANNLKSEILRKTSRQPPNQTLSDQLEEINTHADTLETFYRREKLEHLKQKTDPTTWRIIEYIAESIPYSEIATEMGISEGSIKMRITRLRQKLFNQFSL